MNERLSELSEQAQQYAEYTTPQGLEWLDTFKEKFAELIVRECYEYCKGHLMEDSFDLTYNDGVGDCAIGLLQHFGVE